MTMKRLLNRLRRRRQPAGLQDAPASSLRITNETVAEHRERILAGGRKFKYPLQYPKYRIVIITITLLVLLLLVLSGITTWRLYGAQDTSQLMYRITQALPLPVGQVDGRTIRYSDYLVELRSALHYLSTKEAVNFSSDDGKRQLDYQKRLALNKAIENTYLQKLAKEQNISVSAKDLDDFIAKEIKNNNLGVTEDMYRQVVRDYYDWTFDDYRDSVKKQLLKKRVVAKIDVEGRAKVTDLLHLIQAGKDFGEAAKSDSEDSLTKPNGGDIGFMSISTDDPNGLIIAAQKLQPNQVSDIIEGMDGFYLVKLIERRDNEVHFAKIFVAFKTFSQKLAALKAQHKIQEYISVPETISSSDH